MTDNNVQLRHRILHWVFKISDLKKWIEFSKEVLDSRVYRHEEFDSGCEATCNGPYDGSWSKTMLGPSDEKKFCIELTYNYGIHHYEKGNELQWITLKYPGAAQKAKNQIHWKVEEKQDKSVLVTGPDDQVWRFVDGESENGPDEPFHSITLSTTNVEKAEEYYTKVLGMKNYAKQGEPPLVGYGPQQTKLELVQVEGPIDFKTAPGRVAFNTSSVPIIYQRAKDAGTTILNHPTTLPTPGKADVVVTILKDYDGNEICQVNEEGFDALSELVEGADFIDWEERERKDKLIEKWNNRK
ncbi:glyoxalase [Acrasis kona]|uniref:Glyoxalase n=1 Tax=Acrasis kona TaxID=1008807 RepID=A0AAW2YXX7_9EUKA